MSVLLTAYLLISKAKYRARVGRVYGNVTVYDILRDSAQLQVFALPQSKRINPAIDDWKPPPEDRMQCCATLDAATTLELRQLLISVQNFEVGFVKDFLFGPSYAIRAETLEGRVNLYIDFQSDAVLVILENRWVWTLYTDIVSDELKSLLAKSYGGNP